MATPTDQIAALMKRRNLSAADLARLTGLSAASISRILSGVQRPKRSTLGKIAEALDSTADALDPPPTPSEQNLSHATRRALDCFAAVLRLDRDSALVARMLAEALATRGRPVAFARAEEPVGPVGPVGSVGR